MISRSREVHAPGSEASAAGDFPGRREVPLVTASGPAYSCDPPEVTMRRALSFTILALALGATTSGANILVGQYGPNFTKPHVDGGSVSLSDYPGKVVALFLFGNT